MLAFGDAKKRMSSRNMYQAALEIAWGAANFIFSNGIAGVRRGYRDVAGAIDRFKIDARAHCRYFGRNLGYRMNH
jgi:hypothetical protein